ncbi:unnamed protein product [Amoebophrya sp. A120]|nr:unnamed protein product [Amoebophrya sp. A120]|eukprot:GSA120T00010208001.1
MMNPLRLLVLSHRQTCDSSLVPELSDLIEQYQFVHGTRDRVLSLAAAMEHELLNEDCAEVFGMEQCQSRISQAKRTLKSGLGVFVFFDVEHVSETRKARLENKTGTCWRKRQFIARSHLHAKQAIYRNFEMKKRWKFQLFNSAVLAVVCFIMFVLYPYLHRAKPRPAKQISCVFAAVYFLHELVIREQVFGPWPSFVLYGSERGWVVAEVYERWRKPANYQNNVFFNPFVGELEEAYREAHDAAYTMWGIPPPPTRSDMSLPESLLHPWRSTSFRWSCCLFDWILWIFFLPLILHHLPAECSGKASILSCTAAGRIAFDDLSVVFFLLYPNAMVEIYRAYWVIAFDCANEMLCGRRRRQDSLYHYFDFLFVGIFTATSLCFFCWAMHGFVRGAGDADDLFFCCFFFGRIMTLYDIGPLLRRYENVQLDRIFGMIDQMRAEDGVEDELFAWELDEIPTAARNTVQQAARR